MRQAIIRIKLIYLADDYLHRCIRAEPQPGQIARILKSSYFASIVFEQHQRDCKDF